MQRKRQGWRERGLDRLAATAPRRLMVLSGLLLVAAATADWFSGAEIAASLGYLLPISVAAWGIGRGGAVSTAALCAGSWLFVDVHTHGPEMPASVEAVNMIVLTVAYQLFGLLLATLREQLDAERQLAHTDPLTSLHNRRAFWSATGRELARARRANTPFSIAYLDVDGFKGVNDRFGHRAGDELLRRIARALQQDLRELDMVARLGGDEFVLLLPGAGVAGASKVVSRVRKRLRQAAWRQSFDVDFSVGCLTVLEAPDSVDDLVERADELMYEVKRRGGGRLRHQVLAPHAGRAPAFVRSVQPRGALPPPRAAT